MKLKATFLLFFFGWHASLSAENSLAEEILRMIQEALKKRQERCKLYWKLAYCPTHLPPEVVQSALKLLEALTQVSSQTPPRTQPAILQKWRSFTSLNEAWAWRMRSLLPVQKYSRVVQRKSTIRRTIFENLLEETVRVIWALCQQNAQRTFTLQTEVPTLQQPSQEWESSPTYILHQLQRLLQETPSLYQDYTLNPELSDTQRKTRLETQIQEYSKMLDHYPLEAQRVASFFLGHNPEVHAEKDRSVALFLFLKQTSRSLRHLILALGDLEALLLKIARQDPGTLQHLLSEAFFQEHFKGRTP